MVARVFAELGSERAFELFDFLVLLFLLVSVVTLAVVLVGQIISRRRARAADMRIVSIVRLLGKDLFGDEAWGVVERAVSGDGSRVNALLSVLDRASFETWAAEAVRAGSISGEELELLRDRLTRAIEPAHLAPQPEPSCRPAFGMPVSVDQHGYQVRGTVADVDEDALTVWILGAGENFDEEKPASFMLLSRNGAYQFESRFSKRPDDTLVVESPERIVWTQRRRFGRHPATLPVRLMTYLGEEDPVESTICELGGGGATITNPAGSFRVGNVLTLEFTAGGADYSVTGRVVRSSNDARRLHVRFEAMMDQQRYALAESVVRHTA